MGNQKALVKQVDITRLVKAAVSAGLTVHGVEMDLDGTIRVLTGESTKGIKPDWDVGHDRIIL